VALKDGTVVTSGTLRAFMAQRVPSYMVPVAFRRCCETSPREAKVPQAARESPHCVPLLIRTSAKRLTSNDIAKLLPKLPNLDDVGNAGNGTVAASTLRPQEVRLATLWSQVLELSISAFDAASSFFDFGGSLAFFKLAKAIATDIGISLSVAILIQAPTLSGMATLIFDSAADPNSDKHEGPLVGVDWDVEARKFPIVPKLKAAAVLSPAAAKVVQEATLALYKAVTLKTVLITGCTGYVGAFLLQSLALRTDVESVIALVRAVDVSAADARLRTTCARRALDKATNFSTWYAKVRPLPGDVSDPCFGLSEEAFALLACRTHAIVHAAAEVNMLKPYEALSHTNVGGTSNVLAFSLLAHAPLVFTSTMLPLDGATPTGYRQSKAIAEALCVEAYSSYGVPSAVLQLGDIGIGLSTSPHALPDDDYLVILLRTCITLRCRPQAEWSVSVIPVNQCVNMISAVLLAAAPTDFTAKAREVKGNVVRWETLCEWLAPILPVVRVCSLDAWKQQIADVAKLDEEQAAQAEYTPEAVASAIRMVFLLPAMDKEFIAEEQRRLRRLAGEGGASDLQIDEQWAHRFGTALTRRSEFRQ